MSTNKYPYKNYFLMRKIKKLIENDENVETYQTSKTTLKILKDKKKKYFLKRQTNINELEKYQIIKRYYQLPTFYGIYNDYMIYDYQEDFKNKTINDYLYGKSNETISFNKLLSQFQKSIEKTVTLKEEKETESRKFFYDRIPKLDSYLKELKVETIFLNNKKYNIRTIINDIKNKIQSNEKVYSFLSQGDPTDTNFTTTGYITDFENAGYNSILGEISIFFVSLFSHGRYFYPKYNKKAYVINQSILTKYQDYKMDIQYTKTEEGISVDYIDLKLPKKNKQLILEFIDSYLKNPKYSTYKSDLLLLKYYIGMRLLTPIDINQMGEEDQITIFALLILVDDNIHDLESLKAWIERC